MRGETLKPIDIRPADLETVRRVLREYVPELEVWAFGSRVSWTARDASDLDIVLLTSKPLDALRLAEMREAFSLSDLPFGVDIVDWASVSDNFRRIIEQYYVVLIRQNEKNKARLVLVDKWREGALGDYVTINSPTYSPKEAWPFINYLDTGNITMNHVSKIHHLVAGRDKIPSRARRKVLPGDIVYSTVRPNQKHFGLIKYMPRNFLVSTGFAVLRGKSDVVCTDFIYWYLAQDHITEYLHSIAENSTSAYPSIKASDLEQLTLVIPPLREQRAIARILSALDERIELNRQMNKTLEEMACALFGSWFVDFDPVRAKMDGRWRRGESLPGLPAHLYDLFPDRLVDSDLGKIPKGWTTKTLNHWTSINPESWSRTNVPKEVEYVDLANTKWGVIESTQHFLWSNAPSRAKRVLRSGDTIVGTVRPANGSYSLIATDGLTGSTGFAVLRPRNPRCREFVYLAVTTVENIERLSHRADGAAYPAVQPDVVGETKVVVPRSDHDMLDHFSKTVAPLFNKAEFIKTESRNLVLLRDELLPKLISGELDTFKIARERSATQ